MLGSSICIAVYNRPDYLKKCVESVLKNSVDPFEIIIVDDCSPDVGVGEYLNGLKDPRIKIFKNEKNMGVSATFNRAFDLAQYDCIIHLESDCVIINHGWNRIFELYFDKYPEIGMIGPHMSGRSDYIIRDGYKEVQWILGGCWALRKETYKNVGGWDENLVHQVECDFALRVRMGGYRIAEIIDFNYIHLGEGDYEDTQARQAVLHEGTYNFLKKWNMRFVGFQEYRAVHAMAWDDFPVNEWFRRQCLCGVGLNSSPVQVILPHDPKSFSDEKFMGRFRDVMLMAISVQEKFNLLHAEFPQYDIGWGSLDLIWHTRPPGRERELELTQQMQKNEVFKDKSSLAIECADKPFLKLVEGKDWDFVWIYVKPGDLKKIKEYGIDYGR